MVQYFTHCFVLFKRIANQLRSSEYSNHGDDLNDDGWYTLFNDALLLMMLIIVVF